MKVVPVPVLSDNYAYLLISDNGTTAAVDPVEPEKLMQAATDNGVVISSILTTHHHWSPPDFVCCRSLPTLRRVTAVYKAQRRSTVPADSACFASERSHLEPVASGPCLFTRATVYVWGLQGSRWRQRGVFEAFTRSASHFLCC